MRSVPRGWGFDGQVYTCFFEVIDANGKNFDFGPRVCILDDKAVSGVVLVSKGIHNFLTAAENWIDLSEKISPVWPIENEEVLISIDPLYPYNHKYIVEGFPYVSGFIGKKVYLGSDMSAEFYCKKTTLFDLENNIQGLDYFAIRGIGKTDKNSIISVILRYDNTNSDYTNELFYLKWKTSSSEESSNLFKYLKLKAEFETSDSNITPILSSYRCKLGI